MFNCKQKQECPVSGKCLDTNSIYRAIVNEDNEKTNTYTGLTCNDFKPDGCHISILSTTLNQTRQPSVATYMS